MILFISWLFISSLSISSYATTHTNDSVYILGGSTVCTGSECRIGIPSYTSQIAQYKDNIWAIAGCLYKVRAGHGAINVGGKIMIIGGFPYSYQR